MGPTSFAAILFYCICVVALSSMVVAGFAFPAVSEITPKSTVPEKTPKYAVAEETPKPAVPKITPKPSVLEVTPKYAVPEVTLKPAVPKETPKTNVPEVIPITATPKKTPKYTVPEVSSKPTVPEETPKSVAPKKTAVPEVTPKPTAPKETSKFISMGALECSANITKTVSSRKLVAVQGSVGVCPVRFDHTRGISAVAGSCKDRPFPSAERCCGALKHYACPYSELINDNANNGCANDMFYVIMVRGRLRPGLFSQLCVEGPLGLQC